MKTRDVLAATAGVVWLARRVLRPRYTLAGRVALVTGGSRGLGLAVARELARRGARVAICGRTSEDLVWAKQDLEQRGATVLALPCDVADATAVQKLVADVRLALGAPIDVLVNNAGIIHVGPIDAMTRKDFEDVMATNFWGLVNATMAVLPSMRQRRDGRIANVTSIGGAVAVPHLLAYDCAKFAAVGFSEGLRAEVARDGVGVTTIVPGLMRTGSPVNAVFKGQAEKEAAWFALGDATPLTAMSAARAARRIVWAIEHGEAYVTLSWQAKLLRLASALFPAGTGTLLGVVNRLLPAGDGQHDGKAGRDALPARGFVRDLLSRSGAALNQTI